MATPCRYITDAMQRLLTERERRFLRASVAIATRLAVCMRCSASGGTSSLRSCGAVISFFNDRIRLIISDGRAHL
jgi:hypothetical protein